MRLGYERNGLKDGPASSYARSKTSSKSLRVLHARLEAYRSASVSLLLHFEMDLTSALEYLSIGVARLFNAAFWCSS